MTEITSSVDLEMRVNELAKTSDLILISLGGAHTIDKEQQCPSFCIEAAERGLKVCIINFDAAFEKEANRLITSGKNIDCIYTTTYCDGEKGAINTKEFKKFVLNMLEQSSHSKIVFLDNQHKGEEIPVLYSRLAFKYHDKISGRVSFLLSDYQNSPGLLLNPIYLQKLDVYRKTCESQQKAGLTDEKLERSLSMMQAIYKNHWHALTYYSKTENDYGHGATLATYGSKIFKQKAALAEKDRLGYRFVALQCLELDALLSDKIFVDKNYIDKQRYVEIIKFNRNLSTQIAEKSHEEDAPTIPKMCDSKERPDILAVKKEIERLREKSQSKLSIHCNEKADRIQNALNYAINMNAKDVTKNEEVIAALSKHRICGFFNMKNPRATRNVEKEQSHQHSPKP